MTEVGVGTLDQTRRWIRAAPERIVRRLGRVWTLPFQLGKPHFRGSYLTYQPDSHVGYARHPEYDDLFRRFIRHNRRNNAGDVTRLWSFILNCKQVLDDKVPGDFAELGVWRGNTAAVLAHFAFKAGRRAHLFDTYEGFDSRDVSGVDADKRLEFSDTSIAMVKEVIGEAVQACEFVKGYFPASIADTHRNRRYAVVSLDCDLYEPMKAGLVFFYPRMTPGAVLLIHDYSNPFWEGSKQAVDEFCRDHGLYPVLMPDKSGSALIRKSL